MSAIGLLRITLLCCTLVLLSPFAMAFDRAPHVLVLPGHTNSLSQGPNGEVLVTCDYKTLDGRVPKPGEPCTGEPTLAISVEDLRNLRYVSEAKDNNELVRRVYEKYDDIVFIVSPDFEIQNARPEYYLDIAPVTVRHPAIPEHTYQAFAERVRDALKASGAYDGEHMLGVSIGPYDYNPAFDDLGNVNPLQNNWRPLANYTLILLPSNPGKSTLIHEFVHYLVQSSRAEGITSKKRLEEFQKNRAIGKYLEKKVLIDSSQIEVNEDLLAAYEMSNILYLLEHIDDSVPEEVEVNYFISKYQTELGLNLAANDHKYNYWHFSDYYQRTITYMNNLGSENAAPPARALRYIREDLPLQVGELYRPNYFRNIWGNIKRLAEAYPKNLLGSESSPEPGTMMYQFIRDIGTRAETER